MMRFLLGAAFALFLAVAGQPASAAEFGSPDEAKAMLDRAIEHYKQAGRDKAFEEFNKKDGKFVDRDLYVIVSDPKGVFLSHGANAGLINRNLWDLKDVNGVFIIREMIKAGDSGAEGGWAAYTWTNPVTKKLDPKKTLVKKHDDLYFMVGIYDLTKM